jgi:hypothetical protein
MSRSSNRSALEKRRAELVKQYHRQDALLADLTARLARAFYLRDAIEQRLKVIDYDLDRIVDAGWQRATDAHEQLEGPTTYEDQVH